MSSHDKTKKIYLTCGKLRFVVMSNGPINAIQKMFGHYLGDTVYLDERGHRTDDAQYKVPVEQALVEAGYTSATPDANQEHSTGDSLPL